ncbi:hypothetical protein HHI36_006118 [Cryptolaemus montrouzieri]|uniref:Uncharacterized protein n=1 Tax=Cryptolaemus montrouzieri TaxID=559131 RepID=A0ABD2NWC8_9CUCU
MSRLLVAFRCLPACAARLCFHNYGHLKLPPSSRMGPIGFGGDSVNHPDGSQRSENALDALLDELQTFSKPPSTVNTQLPQDSNPPAIPVKGIPPSSHHPHVSEIGRKGSMDSSTLLNTQNLTVSTATGSLRRLHSYPSGSDTDNSPPIQPLQRDVTKNKPPIPERNSELFQHIAGKRVPPPPPPRTSSKSPLTSPTSPNLPPRSPAAGLQHIQNVQNMVDKPYQSQFEQATQSLGLSTLRRNVTSRNIIREKSQTLPRNIGSNLQNLQVSDSDVVSASNSSSCESVNSQDGSKKNRKEELEQRHQELLKKQKALQEQYARLQQLQRGNNTAVVPPAPDQLLKKTGSESNLLQKMGLHLTTSQMTGSLTNLPNTTNAPNKASLINANINNEEHPGENNSTTNKVYETEIL